MMQKQKITGPVEEKNRNSQSHTYGEFSVPNFPHVHVIWPTLGKLENPERTPTETPQTPDRKSPDLQMERMTFSSPLTPKWAAEAPLV